MSLRPSHGFRILLLLVVAFAGGAALAQGPSQAVPGGLPQSLLVPGAQAPDASSSAPDLAAGLPTVPTELTVRQVHPGKGKPTVGDLIFLTLKPTAEQGDGAVPLEAKKLATDPVEWGDGRILTWKPFDPKTGAVLLVLTSYKAGKYTIKGIPFYKDDKPLFATEPKEVEFSSVGGDKSKDEIYPPASVALPTWLLILLALVVLLMVVSLIFWIARWYRNRRAKIEELAKAPRILNPLEEFELARRESEQKGLVEKGTYKPHYFTLSDAAKRFLSKSYRFDAEERTTRELLFELEHLGMGVELLDQWERIFDEMDLIKFTDQTPAPEPAASVGNRLSQIVALSYSKSPLVREQLLAQQQQKRQQKQKQLQGGAK